MIVGHGVGDVVWWLYRGAVQVGVVEGVSRDGAGHPALYWVRPLVRRVDRRVGKPPADVRLLVGYPELVEEAARLAAEAEP